MPGLRAKQNFCMSLLQRSALLSGSPVRAYTRRRIHVDAKKTKRTMKVTAAEVFIPLDRQHIEGFLHAVHADCECFGGQPCSRKQKTSSVGLKYI